MNNTIAIITDLYSGYQKILIDLVVAELRARSCNVICVSAGELVSDMEASPNRFACNSLYSLVNRYEILGVVGMCGTLGHHVSSARLATFLDQFSIPFVSIGESSPTVPMVSTHDNTGMCELMNHILSEVGVKKPAFIRGIEGEKFTKKRESIYRAELAAHNIVANESHFFQGLYDTELAYDATLNFLQEHPEVDALVATNDQMALGAARAATALGRKIPTDIVISGFDDTDDATKHSPAITTVRQSLDQLAYVAVDILFSEIETGRKQTTHIEVGTKLIVRSSTRRYMPMVSDAPIDSTETFKEVLARELGELEKPLNVPDEMLVDALWRALNGGSMEFEMLINSLLPTINEQSSNWWNHTTHTFDQACQAFRLNPDTRANAQQVMMVIMVLRERIWSLRIDKSYKQSRLLSESSEIQRNLSSSTSRDDILELFASWLEASQVNLCYLVRYENPGTKPDERSELMMVWKEGGIAPGRVADFPTVQLLPEPFRSSGVGDFMLQVPVYSGGTVYGFLIIEADGAQLESLDAIANSLGNALRNRALLKEVGAQRDKLRSTNEKLERLANVDVLTGLPNRLHAQTWMEKRFELAAKNNDKLAVLFLDLDGFKSVNDTFGHAAGDSLLRDVSMRMNAVLKSVVHGETFLARLAGDEFIIVMDGAASGESIRIVCESVRESLCDPFYFDGALARVSVSIGTAVYPDHGASAEATLKVADEAMYRAKQMGKNQIVMHSDDDSSALGAAA